MKTPDVVFLVGGRVPAGIDVENRWTPRSRAVWWLAAIFIVLALAGTTRANNTVTYEQNANGQLESVVVGTSTNDYSYPDDNNWSQSYTTGTFDGVVYEAAPSNWSTPYYPNGSNTDVVINGNAVQLDVTVGIGSLTLANGATLTTDDSYSLGLSGSLTDNGALVVGSSTISFANSIISGTGTIDLIAGFDFLNGGTDLSELAGTYTQEAGITTEGTGLLTGTFTNYGAVNSNGTGRSNQLEIETSSLTNYGVLENTGTASYLFLNGITVTQGTGGQILATNGETQFLGVSQVNGGTLNTSGNGLIQVLDGATTTLNSVTNNGTIGIYDNSILDITGTLVDNGSIVINYNSGEGSSVLNFENSVLSGTGSSILNNGGGLGFDGGYYGILSGTLTQMAGHTISGHGQAHGGSHKLWRGGCHCQWQRHYPHAADEQHDQLQHHGGCRQRRSARN